MRCWMSRIGWSGAAFVGLLAIGATPQEPLQEPLFTRDERLKVLEYWANPERYASSLPSNASKVGVWQVRLSEKASKWLWDYRKALNLPKIPPGEVPPPLTPEQQGWENWIDARVAWDRWQAGKTSEERNAQRQGRKPAFDEPQPPNPGPIPAALFNLAGEPPAFADVVSPSAHRIRFDDGVQIDYVDNPNMRPRYAYYRFPQGVMHAGNRVRDMAPAELERLFEEAGVTASERRVMAVVSLLEGGFESVNTYDTGFVSVGFIQFACLSGGAGSLGQVLLKLKSEKPDEFQTHFRRLGIDVTPSGQLAAISLLNGEELWGPRAAQAIIDDKRLIAVFQRAGQVSRAFRVAQIAVAKEQYYPANDAVSVTLSDGRSLSGIVSDFIKSESAMAILMDRKVNTGKLDPLAEVIAFCAEECNAKELKDLSRYERDIAAALKYRKDYLLDASLTQPGPAVDARRNLVEMSRKGSRAGRTPPPVP